MLWVFIGLTPAGSFSDWGPEKNEWCPFGHEPTGFFNLPSRRETARSLRRGGDAAVSQKMMRTP
jgi:hypothetical protein